MESVTEKKQNDITTEKKTTVLKNSAFFTIWSGLSISNLTFHVFVLSLPIIIYEMTKSTLAMGTMRAIEFVPNILLGIVIGVFIDRYNRKKLMLFAVGIQLFCLITITTLLISSKLELYHLYLLGFPLFTCSYMFTSTLHTIIPLIFNKDRLTDANSVITFTNTFINIIGPSIAGFFLSYFTYKNGLVVSILGLLLLFILISTVNLKNTQKVNRKNVKEEIKEGWLELTNNRALWNGTIMIFIINIASASSGTVLIYFALDSFRAQANLIGFIISFAGVGGLIGSIFAKKTKGKIKRGNQFLIMLMIGSLGQIVMFVAHHWYYLAAGMFLIGFSVAVINIHYLTLRQETTPNHLLGRVAGTSSMVMKLGMPLAFVIVGLVGEIIKVNYVFLGSGIILILLFLFMLKSPIKYLV